MILKGSQRSGAKALADHLMNDRDNDHITVLEVSGFMADDLHGALSEAHAISKATQCKQFMFSLIGIDCRRSTLIKSRKAAG